ncbi:hypothetical protein P618_200579 [Holospora obtusa F1]|uniref:Uncharacterized protein n=2 Tax=Holospora obtusa TaxID=49893 RepID=W6TGW9_HOLOB|nr:hypothetical protein P618_200579 [Holospora obtusa F1]
MMTFVLYYNHQIKLKSLKYQLPFDIITLELERQNSNFNHNPNHMLWGLKMLLFLSFYQQQFGFLNSSFSFS